jgi:hypothetical protein
MAELMILFPEFTVWPEKLYFVVYRNFWKEKNVYWCFAKISSYLLQTVLGELYLVQLVDDDDDPTESWCLILYIEQCNV